MSAAALGAALADWGIAAAVEARDRLAVIDPLAGADIDLLTTERARVVALAAAHGFSHVALDVTPAGGGATPALTNAALSGD